MLARLASIALALIAPALALGACSETSSDRFEVVVIGEPDDPFESGVRLSPAGQLVRAATNEGLVAFDAEGRIVPALADRWIVTDDGLSYIFRLRDGTWPSGEEITATNVRAALRASLRALEGTALALDLEAVDEVMQMAGGVIEIRLTRPVPDLLQILAQPELGLAHDGEGAGPMRLDVQEKVAVLTPIAPETLGMPEIDDWNDRIRTLQVTALDGERAVERFDEGEVDLLLNGRIQDWPRATAIGILRGTIQPDAVVGLFGLKVLRAQGFLAEAANREAVSMAIDRDELMLPFAIDGWVPTTRIVAPGLEGDDGSIGERWAEMTIEERRALAAARVLRWRGAQEDEAGRRGPLLLVWMPEGPGSDLLFRELASQLLTVGVTLERAVERDEADLALVDQVARYPSARWFLNRFNCTTWRAVCDSSADRLVREAGIQTGAGYEAQFLADAEEKITETNGFIPFGPPIRWSLVRGSVEGFSINRWGWHPLMPIAMLPT